MTKSLSSIFATATLVILSASSAFAANVTWGGTDGDWSTPASWSGGVKPAAADTAIFNTGTGSNVSVTGNQTVTSITFTGGATSFTIGTTSTGTLDLTSGGTIQLAGTLTSLGLTETINAPIALGGSYTFGNFDTDNTSTLVFGGTISGSVAAATTLTLNGVNTGNNLISGSIVNGASTALAVTKAGAGTWTLGGSNSYTGATSVTGGTLNLTGTIAGSTTTVNGAGALFNESNTGTITGAGGLTLTTGTVTLAGFNNYTGATAVNGGTFTLSGTMLNSNITVNNGGAVFNLLSSGNITGTATYAQLQGTSNFAGLVNTTGTITLTGTGASASTLNLAGTISGSPIVVSGANAVFNESGSGILTGGTSVTVSGGVFNAANANTNTGGFKVSGGLLNIGNASALGSGPITFTSGSVDNTSGNNLVLANSDALLAGGSITFVGTNSLDLNSNSVTFTAPTTFTTSSGTLTLEGGITNNTGTITITKAGAGTLVLTGATSSNLNGFTVNGGVLELTNAIGSVGTGTVTSGGTLWLSGSSVRLNGSVTVGVSNGGEILLDARGLTSATTTRIAATTTINLSSKGTFLYEGTDVGTGTQILPELMGNIALTNGTSLISIVYNPNSHNYDAAVELNNTPTHVASTGGIALVNGTALGSAGLGSGVSELLFGGAAPAMSGVTASTGTINASSKNTKIVAYLLGESGTSTGANGTVTGTANTFLTYDATNGLRPLNPTDEFMNNAIVGGDNTYITATTTSTSTASINSLVINGGNLNIASGTTLSDTSGAILFVTNNTIGGTGSLNFGTTEGIISADAGVNGIISANIATAGAVTIYGNGTVTLSGTNTQIGGLVTASTGASLAVGSNTALSGTVIYSTKGGGVLESDNQARTVSALLEGDGSGVVGGTNDIAFIRSGTNSPAVAMTANVSTPLKFTNTGTTTIVGTLSLDNTATVTGSSTTGGFSVGNGVNLVLNSITDNNAGNVSGAPFGSTLNPIFSGAGANITFVGSNSFGVNRGIIQFGTSGGNSDTTFYNTVTIAGSGTVSPWGTLAWAIGTPGGGDGGGSPYLVAGNSGLTLANNINATAGNLNGPNFGFAGVNSLTLGGTFTAGGTNSSNFEANIATNGAVLTFGSSVLDGSNNTLSMTWGGFGNYALGSTGSLFGGATFVKSGRGTTTLSGSVDLTGSMTFTGGTVVLDYSTVASSKLSNNLTLNGVNLQLNGGSYAQTVSAGLLGTTSATGTVGATTLTLTNATGYTVGQFVSASGIAQGTYITNVSGSVITLSTGLTGSLAASTTIASNNPAGNGVTTVGVGQSNISQTGGGTSTLALGAIGRTANNGGALNINNTGGAFVTTTSSLSNGILGGYATVNGTDWATVSSGSIVALGTYSTLTSTTPSSSTSNFYFTGSTSLTTTATAINLNTLKIDASANLTLGNTVTLTSGGLLFTGGSMTINGGTLASNSNDLILQAYNTGTITIATNIVNGSNALTKAGSGTVVLTGNNIYTGTTFIDQGTLSISSESNIGTGTAININGGTLEVTSSMVDAHTITLQDSGGTFQVDSGVTLTLNGTLGGSLFKTGSGTLVLNNASNNPNDININAGTLVVGNITALGIAANTTVQSSGSSALNRSYSPIYINGGYLDINGLNLNLPELYLTSGGIIDSTGTGTLASQLITLESGIVSASLVDMIISGSISNNSPLYKISDGTTSGGTVVLTGNNTYSGATIISAGTLQIGNGGTAGTLGTGNVNTGESVGASGTIAFDHSNTVTVANAITGAGALVQMANSTLILSNVNSYTGGTYINAGTISIANDTNIGSGLITMSGTGSLQYTGLTSDTLANNITVTAGGTSTISNTGTSTETLTLAGTLNKANSTLIFSGGNFDVTGQITGGTTSNFNSDLKVVNAATVTLDNSNNDYTGATSVYGGSTLRDGAGMLPAGTVLNLGDSSDTSVTNTFDLNGDSQTVAAINSTSASGTFVNVNQITNGSAGSGTSTLTLSGTNSDGAVASSNFGGMITDGATAHTALAITGGMHTLSGASTFTGGTTLSGGTLMVTNTTGSAIGTGGLTMVGSSATLAGSGIINSSASGATNTLMGHVQVGNDTTTDTSSILTVKASSANIFTNVNLSFNLSSTTLGTGTELAVGSTASSFSGTSITLNLLGGAALADLTQYTLITSTVNGSGDGGSIFSGFSLGAGNVIQGISLNIVSAQPVGYYANSYLVLVANAGGNGYNIDVEVVPEPGTWALMLGGLALLVFFQRARRSKKN